MAHGVLGPPLDTRALHRALRAALLGLLDGLRPDDWLAPTACPGWTVKDVAAHLIGNAVGRLSAQRDGFLAGWLPEDDPAALAAGLNAANEQWVAAWRRASPRIVHDLVAHTGEQLLDLLDSLEPQARATVVTWAGPEPAPNWLDCAREYTEDWTHQRQIREAVGAPVLDERRYLTPVLDTFVRALPHAYRDLAARAGSVVRVDLTGPAATTWSLVRSADGWRLERSAGAQPTAAVRLDGDSAWRLLTRALDPAEARRRAHFEGDATLAAPFFATVAIVA